MTEPDAIGPRIGDAVPFTGIQPGGGVCIDLEARWRRLRRAMLTRLRPGYVRRAAAARVGACPACVHQPIDPRDLKLVRPQCGQRWPDDEAFWRPRLGLARAGLAEVVVTVAACAALAAAVVIAARSTGAWPVWLGLAPVAAALAFGLHFFRDPERAVPAAPDALLAPSDGVVTQVHTVDDPDFPGGRAVRVSVYLSPYDVHLNRAPRAARVIAIRYFPGRFRNARHRDCARVNEQLWVDLEEPGGRIVRVKQISGALARRLVCWLAVGEDVRPGVRYGMIKYGSRADVLVTPGPEVEVAVTVGQRVVAGQTVMMRFGGGA
ncbi:MAG: phosphatidylserine decarboxylase family protein [Myxococcales bacterium]|nr:phosphatidylserine decarboxylase family protein [Myxococcales bacterium]